MHRFVLWAFLVCGVASPLMGAADQKGGETVKTGSAEASPAAPPSTPPATPAESAAEEGKETTSAPAASAPAPAPTVAAAAEKGTYTVRLKDLEDRVNRLKEQIFRSKARLSLLAETVLDRKIAGSQAIISFRNEMSGAFWLNKAIILLDGGAIFNKTDENGNLAERDVIEMFNGPVMPGEHTLSVVLQYRGNGFGIFSYLKGYEFKVKKPYTFSVSEGKAIDIGIVSFEKGSATTPLEERPAISFTVGVSDLETAAGAQGAAAVPDEGAE
jgi:hypothetical protein